MTGPRVLQVLGRSTGGIARHVAGVTAGLDGQGFEVEIAGPPDLPLEMPKELHHVDIPNGVRGHGGAVGRLREIVAAGRYDVLHAHGLRAGIDTALAARRSTPVVLTVHNLVHPEVAGAARAVVYRRAEMLAVRLTDHTFAVSEDIAAHLRRARAGREKVEVLYLGIGDPPVPARGRDAIRRELDVPEETPLIVTASRLAPQKALHVLLDALASLEAAFVLAVLGTGPLEEELKARAVSAGIADRVRWLGFRRDVADHIAAADVFCLSSVWEGVPLAAQEAILLGVPIVATRVGGMPELVDDAVTGRLVPPGDPAALASALRQVLGNETLRAAFAAGARARLAERFSTERMLARLGAEYRERAR